MTAYGGKKREGVHRLASRQINTYDKNIPDVGVDLIGQKAVVHEAHNRLFVERFQLSQVVRGVGVRLWDDGIHRIVGRIEERLVRRFLLQRRMAHGQVVVEIDLTRAMIVRVDLQLLLMPSRLRLALRFQIVSRVSVLDVDRRRWSGTFVTLVRRMMDLADDRHESLGRWNHAFDGRRADCSHGGGSFNGDRRARL